MSKYNKGKIYTIRCINDNSKIYVGSTIQELCKRFNDHKTRSNKEKYQHMKLYQEVKDWNDWYIELYENYHCNNKTELNKREGEIIREIGTLNKLVAGRTKKEHYQENKEKVISKVKEYYQKNKEKILNQDKMQYQNNKKKILEQQKKYREANKEIIDQKNKEKIKCDHCGCEVLKKGLNRHQKSKKCINFVK